MKKVASKLDVEDMWGALQVKEGMGYRKHERRGGDRSAGRAERERVVLQACLPGKRCLEPQAKSGQRFLRRE